MTGVFSLRFCICACQPVSYKCIARGCFVVPLRSDVQWELILLCQASEDVFEGLALSLNGVYIDVLIYRPFHHFLP